LLPATIDTVTWSVSRYLTVLLAWAPLALRSEYVSAQTARSLGVVGRVDAFVLTRDIQRGIRTNATVPGELDAIVGVRRGGVTVTAGGWTTFEAQSTADEPRADLRAGPAGLTDGSAWLQFTANVTRDPAMAGDGLDPGAEQDQRPVRMVLSAGAIRNWYRRVGSDPAVTELYATGRLNAGSWMPSLSAWQAVGGADGLYLEPALSRHLWGNPFTGPDMLAQATVKAGFQIGRRDPEGGAKVPGPLGTGLTHVALAASLREAFWIVGSLSLVSVVGAEVQYSRDPAARMRRNGTIGHRVRAWFPLQVGVSYPFGGHR
jgi:hypothetical protein